MNKRIICLFLSIVVILSILIIPSYAAEDDADFISVDLEWTDMSFFFNEGSWNESTHSYDGRGWTVDGNGGEITIRNGSSVAMNACFEYEANQGFEDISVQFLKEDKAISTHKIETNESVTVSVCPIGGPSELFENAQMGTVIITITKIGEVAQ